MITDYLDKTATKIGLRAISDEPDPETLVYFIANNKSIIVHYGEMTGHQETVTGQPTLALYKSRANWLAVLAKLGVDPDKDADEPTSTPSIER